MREILVTDNSEKQEGKADIYNLLDTPEKNEGDAL